MPTQVVPVPIPVGGVRNDLDYVGDQSSLGGRELDATMLSQSENWIYRDGIFGVRPGVAQQGTGTPGVNNCIQYQHNDGIFRTVFADDTSNWYKYNAGAWTLLTGGGAAGFAVPVFRVFQKSAVSYLIGVSGNPMRKWDGTGGATALAAGSPPQADGMMIVANRLILLRLRTGGTISQQAFDVSAFNDFEAGWGTVLTGLLADTPGDIVCGLEMGSLQGVVYCQDAIYMFTASGGTAPFTIQLKANGIPGPVNAKCVFALPDGSHVFLGRDGGVYRFDGVSVSPIGLNQGRNVSKYVSRYLGLSASFLRAFGFYHAGMKELWFFFAGGVATSCNRAVVIKLDTGAMWPQYWSLATGFISGMYCADPADFDASNRPNRYQVMLGNTNNKVYRDTVYVDGTTPFTDDGNDITAFWQTGMLDPGKMGIVEPGRWATVQYLDHIMASQYSFGAAKPITFKVYSEDYGSFGSVADPGASINPQNVGPYITGHRVTGRAFAIRCDTVTNYNNIQWRGATMGIVQRGRR